MWEKNVKAFYMGALFLTVGLIAGLLVGVGVLRLPSWWFDFATAITFVGLFVFYAWKKYKRTHLC